MAGKMTERSPYIDVWIVKANEETKRPEKAYQAYMVRDEIGEINFRGGIMKLGRPVDFIMTDPTWPDGSDIKFADVWALVALSKRIIE